MEITTIGIVGKGVVGGAVYEGFKDFFKIETLDIDKSKRTCDNFRELVKRVNGPIFICLPTPSRESGRCNTTFVRQAVRKLVKNIEFYKKQIPIVIKSTVPPGTTNHLQRMFDAPYICFNPEFLTEYNAVEDFKKQDRIIIGSANRPEATAQIEYLYEKAFPNIPIHITDCITAELVKYVANCFLACKVSFANEIKQICDKLIINYNSVIKLALLDKRLGKTHWRVPGPDGQLGYGLSCFPKDTKALYKVAKDLGVKPKMLRATILKNKEFRKDAWKPQTLKKHLKQLDDPVLTETLPSPV